MGVNHRLLPHRRQLGQAARRHRHLVADAGDIEDRRIDTLGGHQPAQTADHGEALSTACRRGAACRWQIATASASEASD